ncbi:MAG: carbon monoxide dehydrogenase subunit G [Bacteroidota bacterium]|nr:carbon monoxide dehydrogenase subunit G [Bacteroidota bacterium]
MQLTGKHIINAGLPGVWDMLMDTDTLAKVVPGISRLEKTGASTFKSILEIKIGPVSGSFTGNLQMSEIKEQEGFTLKVQQNSKIGNANAAIKIDLLPVEDNKTEVSFNGDVKLSGLLATMGQRVIGSVSNTISKQFFSNLEKELEKTKVQ